LVHGLFGFDSVGVGRLRGDYFRGVRERLQRAGHRVEVVRLPPLGSVQSRAERLAEQVRRLDAARVNLVAHSMGGLDARYAITKLGLGANVASLTTVGTPHRGTPIADRSALLLAPAGRLGLLERLGAGGLLDVTTKRMAAFNRDVPDSPSVEYFSYVGSVQRSGLLMWTSRRILRTEGDGLVSADSQRWGLVMDHVAADHWAQIGWSAGFDAAELYERIANELAARGF
jgi:triacylglycerol lipase